MVNTCKCEKFGIGHAEIVNYGTQIVSIVRTLKKNYQLRCVATIEFQEIAILLKQRVYNNQKNHDFIQIIPYIYI